ncbi:MAG: hypothetical protein V4561_14215 [Bacteroidota bacterium]
MKLIHKTILAITFWASTGTAMAQDAKGSESPATKADNEQKVTIGKPYFGNSLDGMILSTALINDNGAKSLGTLRFTAFAHVGFTYNYNISKNIGVYTGLDVKNIGLIEKFDVQNVTVKDRVYTVGVPVGLRFGNMPKRNYFFLGGGLDLPFHYKHKIWSDALPKTKFNEWFSDYTNVFMPYLFAGIGIKGTTLKVQYYPNNFFNEDKSVGTTATGQPIKIFANKNVNLLLVSIGRDMNFSKKKK